MVQKVQAGTNGSRVQNVQKFKQVQMVQEFKGSRVQGFKSST
jgi:hypothetical protein